MLQPLGPHFTNHQFTLSTSIFEKCKFYLYYTLNCNKLLWYNLGCYKKGPHGGWIGPHMSLCILSKKTSDSNVTLPNDGRTINLPCEQAAHEYSLGKRSF